MELREWIDFANMDPGSVPLPAHAQDFVEFLDQRFPRPQFPCFRELLDRKANGLRGLTVPADGLGLGVPVGADAERRYVFYMEALRSRIWEARTTLSAIAGESFPRNCLSELLWERLKRCEHCKKFFWASRRDKLTCSATCAVNRRNREWRKHKAEYAHARKKRRSKL
jgi:hypothetical protein